jgi:hypothetical protein
VTFAGLWHFLRGPALGRLISDGQNRQIRGRLRIDSVEWGPTVLWDFLTDRPHAVVIKGLAIDDPAGRRAVWIPYATTRIRIASVVLRGNLLLSKLSIPKGEVTIERRPFGLHDDQGAPLEELGIAAAFAAQEPSPPDPKHSGGAIIAVQGLDLRGLGLKVRLPSLNLDAAGLGFPAGALRFDGSQPPAPSGAIGLSFQLAGQTSDARLSFPGLPPIPLDELAIDSFRTRTNDTGSFEVTLHATAVGARLSVQAALEALYSEVPRLEAHAHVERAGGLASLLSQGWLAEQRPGPGGSDRTGATLEVHLRGPFAALGGSVKAAGFAVSHEGVPPVSELALEASWRPGAVACKRLTARVAGGQLIGEAELSLITLRGTAELRFTDLESATIVAAIAPPTSPRPGRRAGHHQTPVGTLAGKLRAHAHGAARELELDPIALTFTPTNVPGASPMQLSAHLLYRGGQVILRRLGLNADRLDVTATGEAGPWLPTPPHPGAAARPPRARLDARWSIHEVERFLRGLAGLAGGAAEQLRALQVAETHGGLQLSLQLPSTSPGGGGIPASLLRSLELAGELSASGVNAFGLALDRVATDLRLRQGTFSLPELDVELLGGHLRGSASVRLLPARGDRRPRQEVRHVGRPRSAAPHGPALAAGPWVELALEGTELDLARAEAMMTSLGGRPPSPRARPWGPQGALRFEASLHGPLPQNWLAPDDSLTAEVSLRTLGLRVRDVPLELTALVGLDRGTLWLRRVGLSAQLAPSPPTSRIALQGSFALASQQLALALDLDELPLAALPLGASALGLAGAATAHLDVGGTVALPLVRGAFTVRNARLLELKGDVALTIESERGGTDVTPSDTIIVKGKLFDFFTLDARLQVAPTIALRGTLGFRGLPVAALLPSSDSEALRGVRGQLTGRAEVDFAPGRPRPLRAQLVIEQLRAELHTLAFASEGPLLLTSATPIDLVFDGDRVELAAPATLRLPAGEFTLAGGVSTAPIEDQFALALVGSVDLALLRYLFRNVLDDARGRVVANVQLGGNLSRPKLRGSVTFRDARLRPVGGTREILLPRGDVVLDDEQIELKGVEATHSGATLKASGRVGLRRFAPQELALDLDGRLAASALQTFLPRTFSEARGQIELSLRAVGTVGDPHLTGTVAIAKDRPVRLDIRGVRRELILRSGRVELTNNELKLVALNAKVDDGDLVVNGQLTLRELRPVAIDLTATARGLPHRVPGVLDLEVNADGLHLRGDKNQLTLSGDVVLVEGRYKEDFDLVRSIFLSPRTHEEAPPVWKGVSLLETMKLELAVDTAGAFSIQNNLAKIDLTGNLEVVGTLAEPRLNGAIRAVAGTFRIPLLRGDYTVQRGEITFNKLREIPTETPSILIAGETTYLDRTEVEHLITLTVKTREGHGIAELGFEMSSNTGLNTAQCLALLSTGRTTDQLRTQLRGTPTASGSAWTGAAGVSNEFAKQLSGDIISLLVEDPIKKVTRFDRFRVELGTESLDVRVGKRLSRQLLVSGEYRYGLVAASGYNVLVDFKLTDALFLQGQATGTQSTTPYGPDIDRQRLQLKYRIRLK